MSDPWQEQARRSPGQMVDSPIRWVGGKRRLRTQIIRLLPAHCRYVEPFAGAAWVLLGKPPSSVEVLNDKEAELVTFYRVLKTQVEAFLDSFAWDLCARAEFERLRSADVSVLSEVERAHRFFYLVMGGWGGEFGTPRFQTSVNDGGHGNRLIGALLSLRKRILPVHHRLQSVTIEQGEWQECLSRHDGPDTVMYLDPPYPGNGCNYSQNMRAWELHVQIARALQHTRCRWLLSSYDHPAVRELFAPYTLIPVQFYSGMSAGAGTGKRVLNREILVANFVPGAALR